VRARERFFAGEGFGGGAADGGVGTDRGVGAGNGFGVRAAGFGAGAAGAAEVGVGAGGAGRAGSGLDTGFVSRGGFGRGGLVVGAFGAAGGVGCAGAAGSGGGAGGAGGSADGDELVRSGILASWRRCRAGGLGPADVDLPYAPDMGAEELLLRASAPVLERLHAMLVDTPVCVVLSDAAARILVRRAGEAGLNRHLDAVQLAEGFSYHEADAGTNGIGTALAEGRPAVVLAGEHFADRFLAFACAGVPIRDPFSGRIRGVVDLTAWQRDASPLMAALAAEAAENIELRLLEQYSVKERALLAQARRAGGLVAERAGGPYGDACTGGDEPDGSRRTRGELVLAAQPCHGTAADPGHSERRDRQLVCSKAAELVAAARRDVVTIPLHGGRHATLTARTGRTAAGTEVVTVEAEMTSAPEMEMGAKAAKAAKTGPPSAANKTADEAADRAANGPANAAVNGPANGGPARLPAARTPDSSGTRPVVGPATRARGQVSAQGGAASSASSASPEPRPARVTAPRSQPAEMAVSNARTAGMSATRSSAQATTPNKSGAPLPQNPESGPAESGPPPSPDPGQSAKPTTITPSPAGLSLLDTSAPDTSAVNPFPAPPGGELVLVGEPTVGRIAVAARQRLALLLDASGRIGTTLDMELTGGELAEIALPDFAQHVAVDLASWVLDGEEGLPPGTDLKLRRVAVRTIRQGKIHRSPGAHVAYNDATAQARCMIQRRPVLDSQLTAATAGKRWVAEDPDSSVIAAPILVQGVVLGVASFYRLGNADPFDEDDIQLAGDLASRAAVCLDNARRFERERTMALALQRSLLPRAFPAQCAVEVAHRYQPAQEGVGGDWYDVIPLSGGRVALVVGDVVGHGIHAAATMGRLRTAVRNFCALDLPAEDLLSQLDALVESMDADEAEDQRGVGIIGATCLYVVYDPVTGLCSVAAAGHPSPAVVARDGSVRYLDLPTGPPLGLGGSAYEAIELPIDEGSTLVLYTDGLVESREQDIGTGLERLRVALAGAGRDPEELCASAIGGLLPERPSDDVALLAARARRTLPDRVATWDVPTTPESVAFLRAEVSRQLRAWRLADLVSTTELIVSELVTNAIRHATGPVELRLLRDRALICEVADGSSVSPRLRRAQTFDEGGRGLFLVAQLSQRWGTRYIARGKVIWSEQSLPVNGDY
jgi:serine phosphatase RsbU (regulator of sigma subunit)/anti-sigma regulatory factor (Ser/Thr protein kinase)